MTHTIKTFGLVVAIPLALVTVLSLTVVFSHQDEIFDDPQEVPAAEAAVIPGAGILRSGDLSPVLKDRALAAVELYRAGKVKKIIASGDNSTLAHNEVQPIRVFLVKEGIPEEDIFLDYAGFDTYSTLYRARDIFLVSSLVVVSQSFHLPRAVYIARQLGIEAYGLSADDGHYKLTNYFREMFADAKAVVNLLMKRSPKYLGEKIPISGDGRESLPD